MIDVDIKLKWDMDIFPPAYPPTKGKHLSKELVTVRYFATVGLIVL